MDSLADKGATWRAEETEEIKRRAEADEGGDEEEEISGWLASAAPLLPPSDRRRPLRHYQLGSQRDLSGGAFKPRPPNLFHPFFSPAN